MWSVLENNAFGREQECGVGYMGLSSFQSENYFDWTNEKQKTDVTRNNCDEGETFFVRTCHTENTLWANQNHLRIYKHVFRRASNRSEIFSGFWKFQFRKKLQQLQELPRNFAGNKNTKVKVNIFCNITLWMRFFLPTNVHTDQGKTLLRRLCVQ